MNRYPTATRIVIATGFLSVAAFADLQYEMTSRATGGAIINIPIVGSRMKEPHTTTHYLKGNRMATVTKGSSTIWDLDAGTVTTVNTDKKTYSVMTFEQMRQMMEDSMKKMQDAMGKKQNDVDFKWTVDVKDAAEEKTIAGLSAHHYILTMTGEATDAASGNTAGSRFVIDNWMAKNVPGMKEYHDFHKRMAEKMGMDVSSGVNPMVRAQIGKGWEAAAKEMSKMQGFAVLSVVKSLSMANGQEVMVPEGSQQQKGPSAGDMAREGAAGAVLGRLGGLGGLSRKKKTEGPQATPAQSGPMVPATQIEFTTELTSLTGGGFDAAVFAVPAGFKQVEDRRAR